VSAVSHAVTIRQARPEDRARLNEVMKYASLAVESGEILTRLLEAPEHLEVDPELIDAGRVVLAESGGVTVGFASHSIQCGNSAELEGLFVHPDYWRRGIGRLLLGAVEQHLAARHIRTMRVVAAAGAVSFYESAGFSIIGEERTSLGPVVPVMTKSILS